MKNKEFKTVLVFIILLVIITGIFSSCTKPLPTENEKLQIVTTIFPQFDFARQIAGDRAEIMILLSPGIESHTYEPTPLDMKKINDSDIFIYTGDKMEPWAKSIVMSIDNSNLIVVDASKNISMIHEDENDDTLHGADPHIWLDPTLAMIMVDNIVEAITLKDQENKDFYQKNALQLKQDLTKLDKAFMEAVVSAQRDTIVFGGRFAYAYLIDRYNIKYISAYESCSTQGEPSIKKIIEVIDFIKQNDIKVIYHEEMVDPKIAKSIAEQTGVELAVLHTVHNISSDNRKKGKTYIDIMYENLENLKEGLN